jgi:hypothetical protein
MNPEDRHILTTIAHLRIAPNTMIADTTEITPHDLEPILNDLARNGLIEACTIITPDGGTATAQRLHQRGYEHLGITPQPHWEDASAEYLAATIGRLLGISIEHRVIALRDRDTLLRALGITNAATLIVYPTIEELFDSDDKTVLVAAPGMIEHTRRALMLVDIHPTIVSASALVRACGATHA